MSGFVAFCKRTAGKAFVLFLACAAVAVIAHYLPHFDENALAQYVRGKGAQGVALYILATAALSAVGIPRQGLSFVGGYAFGAVLGVIFATVGTTLGCAASFCVSRYIARPFVPERFMRRMERLDAFLAESPFAMTLTVRCMPFGSNALTNILAGVSSIPAFGFIAGSCVGYIPQNFIFSLLGSGMRVDPFWRVLIAALLFLLAFAIGVLLFRRHHASFSEGKGDVAVLTGAALEQTRRMPEKH